MFNLGATIKRSDLPIIALVAGLVVVACAQNGSAQSPKRDVSLRLDWLFQGPNSGFMVAKDKGYYDAAGLNVDIGPGRGSGSTAQLVASKATMFGFSDGYVVGNSVARDMNIVMVAAIYRRNPTAVVVLKDSDIKTLKDLEDRAIAIPTGATQFQQWPAVVKGCNLDGGKINVINIDPAGSVPALVTGKVQAIAGYAQGYVPGVEIRAKKEARILLVRRLRGGRGEQRHHRAPGFVEGRPGIDPALRHGEHQGFPVRAPASRRGGRHHQEILRGRCSRDCAPRAGDVVGYLGDAQYGRQAAGLDVGQGLGIDRAGAQAIWRRNHAIAGFSSVHKRPRSCRS